MDHKANKMLIDATHPEETRVVVLKNGRVEEFDFESAQRKQLRGNIYLAKVTRVEPSLQAAFVEYGGNRHGFLAFNEIHPDYYQIPMADRQALIEEEAQAEAEADAEADARAERRASRGQHGNRDRGGEPRHDNGERPDQPHAAHHDGDDGHPSQASEPAEPPDQAAAMAAATEHRDPVIAEDAPRHDRGHDDNGNGHREAAADDRGDDHIEEVPESSEAPEIIGADADAGGDDEDGIEEAQSRPRRPRRRPYKIQEVIKRRQVILVQVVKEERGNKGAALTTYLSLAGRYTVLMPNTGRGGGISRKITNAVDRKRLKAIAQELDVPEGMGLIIRTAGAARTNQEIRRDYEYLLRLWESVRELTLKSTAPSLVYEEGNLIKRSIRDLYSKDVEEICVAGDAAYDEAHDFMRMMMPSHARNVVKHTHPEALFARHQIERQLNQMFSPQVTLKSGGYIVINQTEALVAIDVNSGRSTREYSIEETALNTNLEAADEIARQLKLRDLAGLIVIDFIDMEEKRNNRAVERRLKDALRFDRARIQVGRISHFGLMEMSRQRMRTGMLEGSTSQCPHCQGSGVIRSTESISLAVLRGIEDHLNKDARSSISVLTTATVALYILNNKRGFITDIENRFGVSVAVQASERMHGANFAIERSAAPVLQKRPADRGAVNMNWGFDPDAPADEQEGHVEAYAPSEADESHGHSDEHDDRGERDERDYRGDAGEGDNGGQDQGESGGRRRRRRRRRGRDRDRGPRTENGDAQHAGEGFAEAGERAQPRDDVDPGSDDTDDFGPDDGEHDQPRGGEARHDAQGEDGPDGPRRRRRRRGRRGGRRGREFGNNGDGQQPHSEAGAGLDQPGSYEPRDVREQVAGNGAGADHAPLSETHASRHDEVPVRADVSTPVSPAPPVHHEAPKPVEAPRPAPVAAPVVAERPVAAPPAEPVSPPPPKPVVAELPAVPDDPTKPVRKGWWQRRILGE